MQAWRWVRCWLAVAVTLSVVVAVQEAPWAQETADPAPQAKGGDPSLVQPQPWTREPVIERLPGAKMYETVGGNTLAFGSLVSTVPQRAHPPAELARSLPARDWRSPWCTQWRDGCERCRWSPEDGEVYCFAMAQAGACERSPIVCEKADTDLITNHCALFYDGCNTCSLSWSRQRGFQYPCTALGCPPQKSYERGFACTLPWRMCRPGSQARSANGFACPFDALPAVRRFREIRRAQTRARLQAYERE